DEAKTKCENEPYAYTGRAEVLKSLGRPDEALAAYDEAKARFENEPYAYTGRAEVLKALGRLDDALAAYEEAIARFSTNRVAQNGLASTLVMLGRYSEALERLPSGTPRTLQDWIGFHVRGMIALKEGNLDQAGTIFEQGLACPFAEQRAYFRSALAMTELRRKHYRDAARVIADERRTDPLAAVIRLHAYGELRLSDESSAEYSEEAAAAYDDVCRSPNPTIVPLRDELAARYVLDLRDYVRRPDQWVYDEEWRLLMCA
ncbi:MAG: tetratricopeptide repeat protein, partial [Planctomycetes bacterium]|nr:tetratricopeptide repeat protein [Planctomycetota bacterium]